MPQLVASPQYLSEILNILPVGVGAGVGVPVEAAHRQQVGVVAVKLVHVLPYRLPRNPINQPRSEWVVL